MVKNKGARVIIEKNKFFNTTSINLFIPNNERNINKNGISHFLEHLILDLISKKFQDEILGARTTRLYTNYYLNCFTPSAEPIIEKFLRFIFATKSIPGYYQRLFCREQFLYTKKNIIAEIKEITDNPHRVLQTDFIAFVGDGKIEFLPSIGSIRTLENLKVKEVENYMEEGYNLKNACLVIFTNGSFTSIKNTIIQTTNNLLEYQVRKEPLKNNRLSKAPSLERYYLPEGFPFCPNDTKINERVLLINKDTEICYINVGFKISSTMPSTLNFSEAYVLAALLVDYIIEAISSGGFYLIKPLVYLFENEGIIGCNLGLGENELSLALEKIKEVSNYLKDKDRIIDKLPMAKRKCKMALLHEAEDLYKRAVFLFRNNSNITFESKAKEIDEVEADIIENKASYLINRENLYIGALGKIKSINPPIMKFYHYF